MSQTLAVRDGDLDINALGSCDLIAGRDKCSQDVAEILLSDYDNDRSYGGKLHTMVVPGLGARAIVSSELQRIMRRLQDIQAQDPEVTASERITNITDIRVQERNGVSTDLNFQISIRTADNSGLVMSDSVRYRPVSLAHTWPNGSFPG